MATPFLLHGNAVKFTSAYNLNGIKNLDGNLPISQSSTICSLLSPLNKNIVSKSLLRKRLVDLSSYSILLEVKSKSNRFLVLSSGDPLPDLESSVLEDTSLEFLPDVSNTSFQISDAPEPQPLMTSLNEQIQETAKNISDTLIENVVEPSKEAIDSIQDVFSDAVESFADSTSDIVDFATESFDSLQKEAITASSSAFDFIQDAIDDVKEALTSNEELVTNVNSEPLASFSSESITETPVENTSNAIIEALTEAISDSPSDTILPTVQEIIPDDSASILSSEPSLSIDIPSTPITAIDPLPAIQTPVESNSVPIPSIPEEIQTTAITNAKSAASKYAEMIGGSAPTKAAVSVDSGDFPDVFSAANSAVSDTLETIKQGAESFSSAIQKSITSGPEAIQDALISYIQSLKSLQSSISSQTKINAPDSLNLTVERSLNAPSISLPSLPIAETVQSITDSTLSAASISLGQLYSEFKDTLPAEVSSSLSEVEEKFSTIAIPVAAFVGQALKESITIAGKSIRSVEESAGLNPDDPALTLIPILGATVFLGFLYWKNKYGGYSGDLLPEEALDVLKNEINSVLVDIRPQPVIELEGIVDLRRSARFKDAYVEFKKIDNAFRKRIRNPTETELMLMAAKIYGLKGVGLNTKVVVMDSDGSESKEVAKALQKYGFQRAYRVEGGYRAWSSSTSLRVKQDAPESTIQILQQEAEAIIEEVKPTALQLSGVGLGSALAIYAIVEWEKFFEFVGIAATAQLIYNIVFKYETAEEFQEDLVEFVKSVGLYSALSPIADSLLSKKSTSVPQSIPESNLIPEESSASDSDVSPEPFSTPSEIVKPSEQPESDESIKSQGLKSSRSAEPVAKSNSATNGPTNGGVAKTNGSLVKSNDPKPQVISPAADATVVSSGEE